MDFLSYAPQFPADLRTFYYRWKRDEDALASYEAAARAFLEDVEADYQAIQAMRGK